MKKMTILLVVLMISMTSISQVKVKLGLLPLTIMTVEVEKDSGKVFNPAETQVESSIEFYIETVEFYIKPKHDSGLLVRERERFLIRTL